MSKKKLIITIVTGIVFLFIAGVIYAATKFVDEIRLKNKAYSNHKEAVVIFQHRKHQGDYREKNPELFNSLCGDCHHEKVNDKENKPVHTVDPQDLKYHGNKWVPLPFDVENPTNLFHQ